jgi:Lectin C-type domain/PEP-CTERM motif
MLLNPGRTMFAALCVGLVGCTTAYSQVIAGPIVNPANGHSYYLLTNLDWTTSQAQAVALGGNLATVNDAAENTWITSQFSNFGGGRALWIGLNDFVLEGTFVWANGEPVVYTNWAPGEPNNQGNEDAGQILPPADFRFPQWNDAPDVINPFGSPTNGVVEVVPEPGSLALVGFAAAGCLLARRRKAVNRH